MYPWEIEGLKVIIDDGGNGLNDNVTYRFNLTTFAYEDDNEEDIKQNTTTFSVTYWAGAAGEPERPLEPEVVVLDSTGDEDSAITINATLSPGLGDPTNPEVFLVIKDTGIGTLTGPYFLNPLDGYYYVNSSDVMEGRIAVKPPENFHGQFDITYEAIASSPSGFTNSTGDSQLTIFVDAVADGPSISASYSAAFEDSGFTFKVDDISLIDDDGSEVLGRQAPETGYFYVKVYGGANVTSVNSFSYAIVGSSDPDATVDGKSLVGWYRIQIPDPISGLASGNFTILPPEHFHGPLTVEVASTTEETSNNDIGLNSM